MIIKDLLREFMLTPAPSGYESEMAYLLKNKLNQYCDEVYIDRIGNCIGKISGTETASRKVMVFGHMDQLGFIVRKVEKDGYIQVDRLGGIPEKVLSGLQLLLRNEEGEWYPGVFATKSHHATPAEEKYKVDPVTSMYIDIGANSDSEVFDLGINVGCPVIYKPSFTELIGTTVSGTAIDNRGACACLVDIASQLATNRPKCDIFLVGTVWEEFNLRGAMVAARSIKPDICISLDVTLAGDTKDLSNRFDVALGKGPCIQLYSFHGRGTLNGVLPHEPLFKLAKQAASKNDLTFQRFAALGILTDASYVQLEAEGVACLEMGFPVRYTHSPIEVCDVRDIIQLSKLVSSTLIMIDNSFDINRY